MIAAIMTVPLIGLTGLSLDYSRALQARSYMQDKSDAIALAMAVKGPDVDRSGILASLLAAANANSDYGAISFKTEWSTPTDYVVTASSTVPVTLSGFIPGASQILDVKVSATARYKGAEYLYEAPQAAMLDPEAGDYNRIAVYCFNAMKASDPVTHGRTQMTEIADNGGSTYNNPMPRCASGEVMSYKLYNSRNVRTTPTKWNSATNEHYEYYTDTQMTQNGETYDLGGWAILETVLCPSLAACKPVSQGGVIPEGKNRTPQHATEACAPGKYMYYGWEDRPPGRGTTDRDYDDIRVIIKCPTVTKTSDELVRLVH